MRRTNKILIVATIAVTAVGGARVALPFAVRSYINSEIEAIGDYSGRVGDVDIALVRGAYALRDLTIVKTGSDIETNFLDLEVMDISLEWRALLAGEVVGEIFAQRPVLNLVQGESERDSQLGRGVNWPARVRELFPFEFNRIEVVEGTITFRAPGIDTDDSLTVRSGHLVLENLSNVQEKDEDAFSDLAFTGKVMSNAPVTVEGKINPNEDFPTFDIDLTLENTQLVDVNPWLEEFLRVDAEQGTFSMYSELAAVDGQFEGYVKPIVEDAEIFEAGEEGDGPLRKVWEALVEIAREVLENQSEDQVATKIPLSGELKDPDADALATIVNLLRNAFVVAFSHALEGTVTLQDVEADEEVDP